MLNLSGQLTLNLNLNESWSGLPPGITGKSARAGILESIDLSQGKLLFENVGLYTPNNDYTILYAPPVDVGNLLVILVVDRPVQVFCMNANAQGSQVPVDQIFVLKTPAWATPMSSIGLDARPGTLVVAAGPVNWYLCVIGGLP
jgi:hypothetical protein